jgi:hypothetical protein
MAALLVRKTTGLDLGEAGRPNPVPRLCAVDPMGVDKWGPWHQPTAASDDHRLVHRELAEPARFGTYKFCQKSCLQRPGSLISAGATPSRSGSVTAAVGDTIR